ncbi:MAG: ArsR family transcriptional regulator [Gammaproteobacteria bacterium]|nr:MAG: ArsR family transcriptional regulator [Gammaproteobacteria bacterium]
MFLKTKNFILLPVILSAFISTSVFASPSIYPTGVTRYDPAKAYNSYVLFAGSDKKTHLIDLNGNEVHQWPYNGFPSVFIDPQLTGGKKGHVLVQLTGETGGKNNGASQSLGEVDWNNKIVWKWGGAKAQDAYATTTTATDASGYGTEIRQHHDWHRLPNGNTLILINYVRPVTGFKAEKILEDGIYELTPSNAVVWKWSAFEHLEEFGFSEASLKLIKDSLTRNDKALPFDYLHFNNMSVVGPNKWFDAGDTRFHPDNIVVASREANFTAIIDKKSGKIVWHIGPDYEPSAGANKLPRKVDQISGQHDAHIIPKGLPGAGNLLVFDNQGAAGYPSAKLNTQPGSRVLEIDPVKKEIVWQYTGASSGGPSYSFYSSYISSARRLPNGNTLIDEGMTGRFIQVTNKGEIVWEYVSPYFSTPKADDPSAVSINTVFRAQPVPYDWVPEGTPRSEKPVKAIDVTKFQVSNVK